LLLDKFEIRLIKNKNNLKIYKISAFYPVKKSKNTSNNTKIASRPPSSKYTPASTKKSSKIQLSLKLYKKIPKLEDFFVKARGLFLYIFEERGLENFFVLFEGILFFLTG
jgi:hypothetical protein